MLATTILLLWNRFSFIFCFFTPAFLPSIYLPSYCNLHIKSKRKAVLCVVVMFAENWDLRTSLTVVIYLMARGKMDKLIRLWLIFFIPHYFESIMHTSLLAKCRSTTGYFNASWKFAFIMGLLPLTCSWPRARHCNCMYYAVEYPRTYCTTQEYRFNLCQLSSRFVVVFMWPCTWMYISRWIPCILTPFKVIFTPLQWIRM